MIVDDCKKSLILNITVINKRGGFNANFVFADIDHALVQRKPDEEIKLSQEINFEKYCFNQDEEMNKDVDLESTTTTIVSADVKEDEDVGSYEMIIITIIGALLLIAIVLAVVLLMKKKGSNPENVKLLKRTNLDEATGMTITNENYVRETTDNKLNDAESIKEMYKLCQMSKLEEDSIDEFS